MKLLYFAWVREKIGLSQEDITPPSDVQDVAGLVDWLRTRGDGYAEALADMSLVRVAVNQDHADMDTKVSPDDEIAIFPPVTGGAI